MGGLVYPPIFLGAGGGHTRWPSSFMVSAEPMIRIVADLLHGFERDGYRKAILLSGHYPNQREYMLPAVDVYRDEGGTMDVLSLIENQVPGVAGDHAAKYETSFMLYLCPDLVDFERLRAGRQDDIAAADQVVNWMGDESEGHPCYGLVGIDPRAYASAQVGQDNTESLLAHLAAWLDA